MADKGKRSLLRLGLNATSVVATAAVAIGLVAVGSDVLRNRAEAIQIEEAAPLVSVSTRRASIVDGYSVERAFVGQVEAQQRTDLAFELAGLLAAVTVEEGDSVRAGQVIARLDTEALENEKASRVAARAAVQAQAELARLTADRQDELLDRGHTTQANVDRARLGLAELDARLAELDTAIAGIEIRLRKSELKAPFDASVGARPADMGATLAAGQPVVSLLQDAAPQIRVGLSEDVATGLSRDSSAVFLSDGREFEARFVRLRPDIDPATRTRTALFELDVGPGVPAPLFGQVGTLQLEQSVGETGLWVPVSALREGTRGLWTVVVLGEQVESGVHQVEVEAVELLYADEERAFVRGTLPDGAMLIDAGVHRVTPGQLVETQGG